MKWFVRIPPYEEKPWWLGMCWRDYATNQVICAPVPFNRIVRIFRHAWETLAYPIRESWWESNERMYWEDIGHEMFQITRPEQARIAKILKEELERYSERR